jgi:hypothetical protein
VAARCDSTVCDAQSPDPAAVPGVDDGVDDVVDDVVDDDGEDPAESELDEPPEDELLESVL